MTEEEVKMVDWKKAIPIIVGLVIGVFLIVLLFNSTSNEVTTTEEVSYPQVIKTEKGLIEKNYDTSKKELSLSNDVTKEQILTAKLDTPQVYQVGLGYQQVAQFTITPNQDYENLVSSFEFYDMNDKMKETNKDIDVKYLAYENVQVNETTCEKVITLNGSQGENCFISGSHIEQRQVWLAWDKNVNANEEVTIGLFTNVEVGEHIEWIPTIAGVKVPEWAEWSSSLNVGLVSYYAFNNVATDNLSTNNWTTNSITYNTTAGKLGLGTIWNSNDDAIRLNASFVNWTNSDWSIGGWVKGDSGLVHAGLFTNTITASNYGFRIGIVSGLVKLQNGGTEIYTGSVSLTDSVYRYWTATYDKDTTNFTFYMDGVGLFTTSSYADWGYGRATDQNNLGVWSVSTQNLRGFIDEVGIWNRTLTMTDITQLYNGGTGITYANIVTNSLPVSLNSPANYSNFTTSLVNFSGNITSSNLSNLTITNVSLIINGTINQSNVSGTSGHYFFNGSSFGSGFYNWTIVAFGSDGVRYNATNGSFVFTVDSSAPTLDAFYPNETITFHERNTNLSLNWSVNDTRKDTCLFQYKGVNTTVTCSANQTTFNITDGVNKSLIFFANDTFGNMASENISWNYRLFLNSETYDAVVIEGQSATLSQNYLTNGTAISSTMLIYNGTSNNGTVNDHGGNNYTVTETITVPTVDTNTVITFNWNVTQSPFAAYSARTSTQNITNIAIDACSANTITLYNFTIYNEDAPTIRLNQTTNVTRADLNLVLRGFGTSTQLANFSSQYNLTNPFRVCLNSSLTSNFNVDVQVQYRAEGYEPEFYNIQNETIGSSSMWRNISLFDLNTTNSQIFKIIFRDASFIPIENALINIQRKYVDEGLYRIVEIPMTDSRGEAVAHLVVDSVIYKINVTKYGVLQAEFNDVIAICQTPAISDCTIDLNAFADTVVLPDFEEAEDFNFTLGYDNSTRVVSSVFTIPSGTSSVVTLNVTREDALGTAVCSDQLTSTSGTLSCVVPTSFGNSTILAQLYVSSDLKAQGGIKLNQNPVDIYGVTLVGLSIFLMMTLIGIGITGNPIVTTLFLMLGVILLFSLNLVANNGLIGATATILWFVVALIIVLIKGVNRN